MESYATRSVTTPRAVRISAQAPGVGVASEQSRPLKITSRPQLDDEASDRARHAHWALSEIDTAAGEPGDQDILLDQTEARPPRLTLVRRG